MQRTVLHDVHTVASARMVEFHGWEMPLNYGSQMQEHQAVRENAGLFDVSHMVVLDIAGDTAKSDLSRILANDISKTATLGKALYSAMLNHKAGVIDDLMVYSTGEGYRVVLNCANEARDLAWLQEQCADTTQLTPRRDLAMLALQGPQALSLLGQADSQLGEAAAGLKPFFSTQVGEMFIATTGYTGERGIEVILPSERAVDFWNNLCAVGVQPVGLAARDTLRLEAGMCLHGNEMDEDTHPLEANLGWTIAWDPSNRDFIGRTALEDIRDANHARLVGLVLEGRGVLRSGQSLFTEAEEVGIITSGGFSPTLQKSIALARVRGNLTERVWADIRGRKEPVEVVKPVFVRNGREVIKREQD